MKLKTVTVENFRILENVTLTVEDNLTVIVGRNNSGKTSFTELFYRFFSDDKKASFRFEDFSISSHDNFLKAFDLYKDYKDKKATLNDADKLAREKEIATTIPVIRCCLYIEYQKEDSLASLTPFIMDLDTQRMDASILTEFSPKDPLKLFDNCDGRTKLIDFLKANIRSLYTEKSFCVDSKNSSAKKVIEKKLIFDLFCSNFIYAQRHIADQQLESSEKLARGFESYFNQHHKNEDLNIKFQQLLNDTGLQWDQVYEQIFKGLVSDLKHFGYPGLNSHDLKIKSQFELNKILKGSTNVLYQHSANNLLPEAYNGLGFKNLIYIILQFINFYENFKSRKPTPCFQVLFIEEPEAHLHPQMQYTFIRNITSFIQGKAGWNVQVIVTTHSSHIVAESGFDSIKYFENSTGKTNIKDLRKFDPQKEKKETIEFLKQYLTLSNCDMFFADKIIMSEGTVERLLMPVFLKKIEEKLKSEQKHFKLPYDYISFIEVGGAYAHRFKELLEFLEVKTLIITDIDAINTADNRKKCAVSKGDKTSNQTLVAWVPKIDEISKLLECTDDKKVSRKVRVAYQIQEAEGSACGRSFEEAFILSNAEIILAAKESLKGNLNFATDVDTKEKVISSSYDLSDSIKSKTDFAFFILDSKSWVVPKYIEDGLLWLDGGIQ
jgi:predicted ATP-dependent endonuclease of OLD family